MSDRRALTADALHTAAADGASRSSEALLALRTDDGRWTARLTPADPSLACHFVSTKLGAENSVLRYQLADGGFALYPSGPAELNLTVSCYAALKRAGLDAGDERMQRARQCIERLGGLRACTLATKTRLGLAKPIPVEKVLTGPVDTELLPMSLLGRVECVGLNELGDPGPDAAGGGGLAGLLGKIGLHGKAEAAAREQLARRLRGGLFPSAVWARKALGQPVTEEWTLVVDDPASWGNLPLTQQADGGWAAFDGEVSAPDVTGLAMLSAGSGMKRGVEFLFQSQEQEGSWRGRLGVAYICGTSYALRGLAAAGVSDREAAVLRGGEWLRSIQNADGGWGESCGSHAAGEFVAAASSATQTAWAILGLLAGGDSTSLGVTKGVEFLLGTQRSDGTWDDDSFPAAASPGSLYFSNSLFRISFPSLALSGYSKTTHEVS